MVMSAAATGLRPGEWIALGWRDLELDLDEPVVYVRRAFRDGRLKCPGPQETQGASRLWQVRSARGHGQGRS